MFSCRVGSQVSDSGARGPAQPSTGQLGRARPRHRSCTGRFPSLAPAAPSPGTPCQGHQGEIPARGNGWQTPPDVSGPRSAPALQEAASGAEAEARRRCTSPQMPGCRVCPWGRAPIRVWLATKGAEARPREQAAQSSQRTGWRSQPGALAEPRATRPAPRRTSTAAWPGFAASASSCRACSRPCARAGKFPLGLAWRPRGGRRDLPTCPRLGSLLPRMVAAALLEPVTVSEQLGPSPIVTRLPAPLAGGRTVQPCRKPLLVPSSAWEQTQRHVCERSRCRTEERAPRSIPSRPLEESALSLGLGQERSTALRAAHAAGPPRPGPGPEAGLPGAREANSSTAQGARGTECPGSAPEGAAVLVLPWPRRGGAEGPGFPADAAGRAPVSSDLQ